MHEGALRYIKCINPLWYKNHGRVALRQPPLVLLIWSFFEPPQLFRTIPLTGYIPFKYRYVKLTVDKKILHIQNIFIVYNVKNYFQQRYWAICTFDLETTVLEGDPEGSQCMAMSHNRGWLCTCTWGKVWGLQGVMREMRMSVRRKSLVRMQWLWGRWGRWL